MLAASLLLLPAAARGDEPAEESDGDVIVEGERRDRSDPNEAGESVTVIPLDTRLPAGSDVADAVARAPGTTVRRLGGLGSYAAVSLRGSAQRQVQVHLDGLPLNPDGSAAVNLAALPLAALDRVVVWRGAAPPELAASPIGGVVDLRTREAGAPLSIRAEGGSWTTARASVSGGTTLGGIRVLGGATALGSRADFMAFDDNNSPGVRTDDRLRRRIGNDRLQATGLLQVREVADGGWSGLGAFSVREEGLAGPIGGSPLGRLRTLWGLAAVGRELGLSSELRGYAQVRDELRTPEAGDARQHRFAQAGLHAHTVRPGPRAHLGVSGQARIDAQQQLGTSERPLRASLTAVPYVRWLPSERTAIEPVLHTQAWLDRGFGDAASRISLNPRISLRTRLHEHWLVHAAAGRAVRPPDFLELFGDRGATLGGATVGRPDLRPEKSVWADVGVRLLADDWGAELNLFGSDAVDRIVFVQNGTDALVPVNYDPSSVLGAEAAVSRQREHLDGRLALTWTEAWLRAGPLIGRRLPRIPQLAVHADAGVTPLHGLRLSLSADGIAGNAWDEGNLYVAPPRVLLGADLRFDPGGPWPAAHVGIRNLGDRIVHAGPRDPLYPDSPRVLRPVTDFVGYPLPGRTLVAGLTWTPRRQPPEDSG